MKLAYAVAMAAILGMSVPGRAEVIRFETLSAEKPALQGRAFGNGGQVDKIVGRAIIAVDPSGPHNAIIADIALAPRNADGRVEAAADVVILRPARPNGLMLLDIPNRGRKLIGLLVEESPIEAYGRLDQASDAGRGFLLARGYTVVWVGWQGDVAPGSGHAHRLAHRAQRHGAVSGRMGF